VIVEPLSMAELAADIMPVVAEWTDEVVPGDVPPISDHRYTPSYAWMYSYEKRLKHRIEEALGRSIGRLEAAMFGADGALSEVLSNAFVHGHRRDPSRPIVISVTVGEGGIVARVQDQGPGFEIERIVGAANDGGTYFRFAGNGLRTLLQREEITAYFSDNGRSCTLRVIDTQLM
jgi:hypothetical protein